MCYVIYIVNDSSLNVNDKCHLMTQKKENEMDDYDGSRGYGSSGDRDPIPSDIQIGAIWEEIEKLKRGQIPEHNSDEGDEFVRKALIDAHSCCEERDEFFLEYVIKMYSTPDQWEEFYDEVGLKHNISIGRDYES